MLNLFKSPWGVTFQALRRWVPQRRAAEPLPAARRRSPELRARADERLRVRLMRGDLFRLLQQHAGSRRLMRHLGLVERNLRKQGWGAVESLPTGVIAKALAQLELLVQDWSIEGLAELRSRLAMRLRHPPADLATSDAIDDDSDGVAAFDHGLITSDDADVGDLHLAAFEEMERSWAGRAPAEKGAARA